MYHTNASDAEADSRRRRRLLIERLGDINNSFTWDATHHAAFALAGRPRFFFSGSALAGVPPLSVTIVASNDLTFFFSSSSSFSAAFRSFAADCGAITTGVAIFFGLPGVPFGFGVPAAEFGVFGGLPRPLFGVGVAAGFATGVTFGVVAVFGGRPRGFGVPSAAGFLGGRPRGLLAGTIIGRAPCASYRRSYSTSSRTSRAALRRHRERGP